MAGMCPGTSLMYRLVRTQSDIVKANRGTTSGEWLFLHVPRLLAEQMHGLQFCKCSSCSSIDNCP